MLFYVWGILCNQMPKLSLAEFNFLSNDSTRPLADFIIQSLDIMKNKFAQLIAKNE